jgi:uncharacterized protein
VRGRRLAGGLALVLMCGCSGDVGPQPQPQPQPSPSPSPAVGQRIDETVDAVLGGVPLRLEVADEPDERAVGLMGRTEVPPGTGMVFRYDEAVPVQFYMFQVAVPLTAVFLREGEVVSVAQMPPCEQTDPRACPVYGPDEPIDTVVETAPETLPDVKPGDRLEYR